MAKADTMAAKIAQSSYKSTAGQSQKPHDDSMAHQLDNSLDEVTAVCSTEGMGWKISISGYIL